MDAKTLFEMHRLMLGNEVIMTYSGYMSQALLTSIASVLKQQIEQDHLPRKIMRNIASEVVKVAISQNVNVEKIGSASSEAYLNPNQGDNLEEKEAHMIERAESLTGGRPSLLQDVLKKRKTEVEFLNGLVSKLGKKKSISTPFNNKIISILNSMPVQKFEPKIENLNLFDELLGEINEF